MIVETGTADDFKRTVLNLYRWTFMCGHSFVASYASYDQVAVGALPEVKTCWICAKPEYENWARLLHNQ